jgi:hypothetical protein
MAHADEILKLARDCFAQARAAASAAAKAELLRMGDEYMKVFESMQRNRPVIHTAFAKPDKKIG